MKKPIIRALIAQTIGGLRWELLPIKDPTDLARKKNLWGWHDPALDPHWQRVADAKTLHDYYEALKNVVSEWARLDPNPSAIGQRATKIILAWAFLTSAALGLITIAAVAAVVIWVL